MHTERMPDQDESRRLRIRGLPGYVEGSFAGGARFVAYCLGADARAWERREAVGRAWAAHQRVVKQDEDPYPTALIVAQRLGVALEDLARIAIAIGMLHTGEDAFDALRRASIDDMTNVLSDLARDGERMREVLRVPTPDTTEDLPADQRSALLEASEIIAARWRGQWQRAASGWLLLVKLAKAMRHGSPLIPRELVVESPGAGALGEGHADPSARWVLVVDTAADSEAKTHQTSCAVADLGDDTLARARQGGLDAIALAKQVAEGHAHRVMTQSKWALPRDAMNRIPPSLRRILTEHERG
jgi:hypothetical protein